MLALGAVLPVPSSNFWQEVEFPIRPKGDAWEKTLRGWINARGHAELTKECSHP
jgi:hypothetical protein